MEWSGRDWRSGGDVGGGRREAVLHLFLAMPVAVGSNV